MRADEPNLRFGDFEDEWTVHSFNDVAETIPSKAFQIPSSEYKKTGTHPIVDQGRGLVAGYSDRTEKVFRNTPIVVFGDHTTEIKLVDFPFVVGADGTKLIKSKEMDTAFLYYSMLSSPVAPTGYNRHFSILRERLFSVPSLEEQKRIAAFLSTVDDKTMSLREHEAALLRFKAGLMQKLFSQELRFQQDNGEDFPDWGEAVLPEVAQIRKGKQLSKADMKGGIYPVMNGSIDPVGWHDEPNREAGGIAMTQGGKCGQVRFMDTPYWSGGDSFEIRPHSVHPAYLFYWLQMNQKYFEDLSTGGALKHLSKDVVTEFIVPLPSGPEQVKIGEALAAMDSKIDAVGKEIALMETFKKGLLQQMFV